MPNQYEHGASVTIFALSAARFNAVEAKEALSNKGIKTNLIHVVWLKPFQPEEAAIQALTESGCGLVIDSAYEIAGASQSLAYELMLKTGRPVRALGQLDRSPGASPHLDNGTPTVERIVSAVKDLLTNKNREPYQ
jgi:pyruvate/2-oxoglutarate/acetoin dehydrogenase E1 component